MRQNPAPGPGASHPVVNAAVRALAFVTTSPS